MANKPYHRTPTGKGVIATSIIGIIAILVQTCLSIKQSNREVYKDSRDSIRAAQKDRSDSVRTVQRDRSDSIRQGKADSRDSARYAKSFTYDSLVRIKQNMIAQRQLDVVNSQFYVQRKDRARDDLDQLFKLDAASVQLNQLHYARATKVYMSYGIDEDEVAWTKRVEEILEGQLTNINLLENKKLHKDWLDELRLINDRLSEAEIYNLSSSHLGDQGAMARHNKGIQLHDKLGGIARATHQYCQKVIPKQTNSYLAKYSEKKLN